ncbi:GNAT family N-acetyltransferase [Sphingomonas alpina]|uniref:GNAT family N-acetyltransferase n=1 Tax=Sphingomonas alpina TaxID=653931 RepID=A0A7H0LLK9_9SPHN|nr:GNAT family N-acetyltransferase [Sphingomonas alpina]QNQ10562.1 GNAT family N-acetyltransferase [Sphingomonas alpina]
MFARTKRLTLRPGWPEEAPELAQAIAHESVAMKLARVPWPYHQDHAADWLARPRTATSTEFVIVSHEHGHGIVGGIGLHEEENGLFNLGYWLTPDAWGRGYATEAGRAVLHMARHALGLKRLTSGHFVDNPASGQVLHKLGFREIGRAPLFCLARGREVASVKMERDLSEDDRGADMCLAA